MKNIEAEDIKLELEKILERDDHEIADDLICKQMAIIDEIKITNQIIWKRLNSIDCKLRSILSTCLL